MKIRHVSEIRKMMTEEQKKESDENYEKFYGPYKDLKPLLCGPEARAAVKGTKALEEYYAEDEDWLNPVDLEDFE